MNSFQEVEREIAAGMARKGSLDGLRLALWAVLGFLVFSIVPVAMVLLSGPPAAGASAGFTEPLQHPWHMVGFVITGMVAMWLGGTTVLTLPLSFALMLAIGALSDATVITLTEGRVWLFLAVMLYAFVFSIAWSRKFVIAACLSAGAAFYFGTQYMHVQPALGTPGYFLIGAIMSVGFVMACGVSVGVATLSYIPRVLGTLAAWPGVGPVVMRYAPETMQSPNLIIRQLKTRDPLKKRFSQKSS